MSCVALAGCHCGQNGVIYTGPHAVVTPGPGADQTRVLDGNLVSVMSWYDNEWGFSNRMVDTAVWMGKLI